MTTRLFGPALTLLAYTDTATGLWLRSLMAALVGRVDPLLAEYIVFDLHF